LPTLWFENNYKHGVAESVPLLLGHIVIRFDQLNDGASPIIDYPAAHHKDAIFVQVRGIAVKYLFGNRKAEIVEGITEQYQVKGTRRIECPNVPLHVDVVRSRVFVSGFHDSYIGDVHAEVATIRVRREH